MPTVKCPNCDTLNAAPAMGSRLVCSACAQPFALNQPPPVAPVQKSSEETELLRDAVRCLRVIAMYVAVIAAFVAALMFGGDNDSSLLWLRRGAIFWGIVFVLGWIVLTRRRVV